MERVQRRGARSRTGAHLFVAVGLIALSFLPQSLTYSPSLLSLSHGVRTQPPRATFSSPLPLARPLQNHQKARLVVLRESEAAGAEAATADPEMSRMEAAEQKAKSEVYHVSAILSNRPMEIFRTHAAPSPCKPSHSRLTSDLLVRAGGGNDDEE
eukprot:489116-Rhodomonas_salina.1